MDEAEGSGSGWIILGVAAVLVLVVAVVGFVVLRSGEARVSGTVTLDTVPLTGAQVVFIGEDENNQAPILAQTDDKGTYRLVGNKGAGVPTGKYKVMVSKMTLRDGTVPMGELLEQARTKGLLQNRLPKVYEDRSTTPVLVAVRSGANTVNVELKK